MLKPLIIIIQISHHQSIQNMIQEAKNIYTTISNCNRAISNNTTYLSHTIQEETQPKLVIKPAPQEKPQEQPVIIPETATDDPKKKKRIFTEKQLE